MPRLLSYLLLPFLVFALMGVNIEPLMARDAAFLEPQKINKIGDAAEAIAVEPKQEVSIGETDVNVARRTTAVFVNQSNQPVEIVSVSTNGDANVRAEIVADDCTKLGTLGVGNRCSVLVEFVPLSAGEWAVELIMTHKGAGRLARMKLTGKTKGSVSSEKKETGLQLSGQNVAPVDFEDVEVGMDRAVRTALMVNDSSDTIKILSVDVIAPDNGLTRFEQGCAVDEELKPGESCPVTLLWKPEDKGIVSTDLIIRHNGKRGFTVIPVRGVAKLPKGVKGQTSSKDKDAKDVAVGKVKVGDEAVGSSAGIGGAAITMSPTASQVERLLKNSGSIAPVYQKTLSHNSDDGSSGDEGSSEASYASKPNLIGSLKLIGVVGSKAVFYYRKQTFVVEQGEAFSLDDQDAILTNVGAREVEVRYNNKNSIITMKAVAALMKKAQKKVQEEESAKTAVTGVSLLDQYQEEKSATQAPKKMTTGNSAITNGSKTTGDK
ncbi:MAG: hypothetical protein AB7S81_05555 [Bdellovibrionales bacterium]